MKGLVRDQRKILAEFCSNFSVAWLAAGIIAPYVSGQALNQVGQSVAISVLWSSFSLIIAIYLTRNGGKK